MPEGSGVSKVRVNVKHDIHGVFSVQSAEMMKEVVKVHTSVIIGYGIAELLYVVYLLCVVCLNFTSKPEAGDIVAVLSVQSVQMTKEVINVLLYTSS